VSCNHPHAYTKTCLFASLFGKVLSELAIDRATGCDIGAFRIDRPALLEKNPPKHFLT
jgi:hypothetical protein